MAKTLEKGLIKMKIPDGYKTFNSFEEKLKKYREWDFKNRKRNELKTLYYKGVYSDRDYDNPEECDIIGYYDNTRILIELKECREKVIIDINYLKQMQSKNFVRNQSEDDRRVSTASEDSKGSETDQLSFT